MEGGGAQAGAGGVGTKLKQPGYLVLLGIQPLSREREKKKTPIWWSRLEKKVEEDGFYSTTCAVCMIFVLQYLSTSQLQREKQSKTPLEGVVAGQWGKWGIFQDSTEVKWTYLNKYGVLLLRLLCRVNFQGTAIYFANLGLVTLYVPLFTAELGRWRSEDTL